MAIEPEPPKSSESVEGPSLTRSNDLALAEARRRWQKESLARLSAAIGHQFNNINTVIMGYLQIALSDPQLPKAVRSDLDAAFRAAQRVQKMTTRLQASLRLDEALTESLAHCAREARLNGVTVEQQLSSTMPVVADLPTVDFVLRALVQNSVHALRSLCGRTVMVKTRDEAQRPCPQVSDRGFGIAAGDIPKVFTPFFTRKGEWATAGSSQSGVRGIGLSLAISRSLVEAVGGSIELESHENVGTTVTV